MATIQEEISKLPFKLEHISYYVRRHESGSFGTFIIAYAKKEFCDEWNYTYSNKVREGIYKCNAQWKILGKEYPKFRKLLAKLITKKENFKSTQHGINAGTCIAKKHVYNRYAN